MRDSYNGEHVNMKRWQLIMPGGFLWLWGAAESWWWAFTFHHSNPLHLFCLYNACLKCALTKRIAACCDHLHFRIFIDCKRVFFLFFFPQGVVLLSAAAVSSCPNHHYLPAPCPDCRHRPMAAALPQGRDQPEETHGDQPSTKGSNGLTSLTIPARKTWLWAAE